MPRQTRPAVPAAWKPWIDSFALSLRAAGRSSRTVETYCDAVGWLAGTLREVGDPGQVGVDQLRHFFVQLQGLGYAPGYVNNVGRSLQAFFKWYSVEEGVTSPFGDRLKPPPPPRSDQNPPPVIAVEQLAALLKDADKGRDFESLRDAALLRLFAATGCRLSELALLPIDAIDLYKREATVVGKGSRVRTVRFDYKTAVALDRYLRARGRHNAVVRHVCKALWIGVRRTSGMTPSGVRQVIERRGERLGLDIHPHLFRHGFASHWLDAGGAEGDLMELMGWDSPQMLRHYGRSARSARARRAYDRIDVMGGI